MAKKTSVGELPHMPRMYILFMQARQPSSWVKSSPGQYPITLNSAPSHMTICV